jgi:hypothetical protein
LRQNVSTDESGSTGEELDFKAVFARILEKEDWTDKLASGLGKILGKIHRSHNDTKLSEELRSLVPNMKEVEQAYVEMTSGYKDFIREVWKATRMRQETQQAERIVAPDDVQ